MMSRNGGQKWRAEEDARKKREMKENEEVTDANEAQPGENDRGKS